MSDYDKDVRNLCDATAGRKMVRIEHVEPEDPCPFCAAIKARDLRVKAEARREAFARAAQKFNDLAQGYDETPEKGRAFLEAEDWMREMADDETAALVKAAAQDPAGKEGR